MNDLKVTNTQELNEMKAKAVMEFVNTQVGAFEANFVEGNEVSLYSMYRFAQLHISDNYDVKIDDMANVWGDHMPELCKSNNEKVN